MAGIGDMISSFFSPEKGYEEAEKEFRKFWDEAKGQMQPFIDHGKDQYGTLSGAENDLLHPETLLNKWMNNYQTSEYAKKSMENAKAGGLDAASSMGLMGSSAALSNIQNSASDIMNKDRSEYLKDLMEKYMGGVGIGKDIYGVGAQTANNFGTLAHGFGQDIGGARGNAVNAPGNTLGNLISMAGNIYGKYMTGGAA